MSNRFWLTWSLVPSSTYHAGRMAINLQGIKRDVAEVKFLIHDLRVERFIDEIIHFHVGLDTDLELYGVTDAKVIHGEELQELRSRAVALRAAYQAYSNAVRSLASPEAVLEAGKTYIRSIYDLCELILHPLWVHIEAAISLLPPESRSVRSRSHYRNSIRWLCGVYYRIQHFWAEQSDEDVYEVFDLAHELEDYVRNVVYGYVTEKGAARVELRLGRLDHAVLGGNRHRFRRMYFNLIMNSVDAMDGKKVGVIEIEDVVEDGFVTLIVRDDGSGMEPEKIAQLMADRESLDGELHSLGFVFVRQTVADFGGALTIDSEPGVGTTIQVRLPVLDGVEPPPKRASLCAEYDLPRPGARRARERPRAADVSKPVGELVLTDYRRSEAEPPGCVFAIGVDEDGRVDLFAHRPYERLWNIGHEDLLPMYYESTIRGRLEHDEGDTAVMVLKGPINVGDYFDMRGVPDDERSAARYVQMVHDELVRIARVLVDTGLPGDMEAQVADHAKFLPELTEPFTLGDLAGLEI